MRDRLDRYYTPDAVARACVAALPDRLLGIDGERPPWVIEPSCGGGAFVRALQARQCITYGLDIDPDARGLGEADANGVCDYLEWYGPSFGAHVAVGNPPYRFAREHIEHTFSLGMAGAFLLRLAFLEGQRRRAFWAEYPPSKVWVLPKRPSFTGGGTDATASGFFVWDPADWGAKRFDWLPGEW